MKTPSLLSLLLAAAVPAFSAPAAPTAPADRCDVAWLKSAAATPLGVAVSDPNKYLSTPAGSPAPMIDVANPTKLCDATVWHYLAVLGPVGEPILDPKTHQPIGGLTLRWNDPALQQDWAAGLSEQIKILLAVDDLYKRVDALGVDALSKADAAVDAAVKSGVVARKDGASLDKVKKDGYTVDAFAADSGYTVAAPAPASPGAAAPSPADLKAAFSQLVVDAPAKPAPKKAKGKPAPKAAPAALKAGPAVAAFRAAIIALGNELAVRSSRRDLMQKAGVDAKVTVDFTPSAAAAAGAKAALAGPGGNSTIPAGTADKPAAYEAAVKFITDPAIAAGDDESTHDSAALSSLDYGLRNLIALRVAAVDQSVEGAKKLLAGRSVAETLAATGRAPDAPANTGSATMAAAVLEHLKGIKDYQDLSALYDKNSSNPAWVKSDDGQAVAAQLHGMQADAAATTVVSGPNGRELQYSIGGQKVTDEGIAVADLDKSQGYRDNIADAIAQNIAANPFSAKVQAALAAFRGTGAPGTVVSPPLTPDQKNAAAGLPPIAPAVVVKAPASPYDALMAATPGQSFLGRLFHPEGAFTRYDSKMNEDAAAAASAQADQRAAVEAQANAAADAVQARAAVARAQVAAAPTNPDLTMSADDQRKAALAAFDQKTAADVQAARQKVIDDAKAAKKYVDSAQSDADLKAKQASADATIDAAYSDGIARAAQQLNAAYDQAGSPQRKYAESRSGYQGPYYKTDRVDRYFKENWQGDKQAAAIAKCKAALGYAKGGDSGKFKDPSPDNVDKLCGVRDGLVALLDSYKGTVKTPPAPAAPAAPAK